MKSNILFDLGNTLVQYYERSEFPEILKRAIIGVCDYLSKEGLLKISQDLMWQRVEEENYEAKDYSVRPLEDRLTRIFQLDNPAKIMDSMCRRFMKPIFALSKVYDDVLPVFNKLGEKGFRRFSISNTPWGSPTNLWQEEIKRLGISDYIEKAFFCRDAGWRKPARQIFDFVLADLQLEPQDCIFVGDDPRWDLAGPKAVGMEAIIIDRQEKIKNFQGKKIKDLYELLSYY